jgi:hypothetical protein
MTILQRILSKGAAGYYARLQLREMVEPTAALEGMVRDVVVPQRRVLVELVDEFMGNGMPRATVDLCVFSLASQCLFLGVSEPVRRHLVKRREFSEPTIAAFADHVTDFCLAGMARLRALHGEVTA